MSTNNNNNNTNREGMVRADMQEIKEDYYPPPFPLKERPTNPIPVAAPAPKQLNERGTTPNNNDATGQKIDLDRAQNCDQTNTATRHNVCGK